MRRSIVMAAAVAAAFAATPSFAGVVISATPGSATYTGPVPTYDFEAVAPLVGGGIYSTSASSRSQPIGSTGNFAVFGPTGYGSGVLSLAAFPTVQQISFIWGSVDPANMVEFLSSTGTVLASFTGSDVAALTTSFGSGAASTDPVVYFSFTGADAGARAIRFSSSTYSFEIDNVSVAVPEPATWAMMVLGFMAVGLGLRRRKAVKTTVSFA